MRRPLLFAATLSLFFSAAPAFAQEASPDATPAPSAQAASDQQTPLDKQYDGRTHVTLAPYVWLPTLSGTFSYKVPARVAPSSAGAVLSSSVQVGPSEYLPKLNSAGMFSFDARRGNVDLFGDIVYVNVSTTASFATTISGPLGVVKVPASFDSTAQLSTAMWEAALGYTVARSSNFDMSVFGGVRELPLSGSISYNATIGKRGLIAPSGSADVSTYANDVIVGLRGRAFLNDRLYVPYYADLGNAVGGVPNQSWQAYAGAGYAFPHGQSFIALWRALDYNGLPPAGHVQKLTMSGPLLGYTFQF